MGKRWPLPLFFIDFEKGKLTIVEENYKKLIKELKNYKNSLLSEFLGKYAGGSLVSARALCSVNDASESSSLLPKDRLVLNFLRKEDREVISTLEEKQGSPKELGSLENSLRKYQLESSASSL